jgi:hypothetical protein
LLAVAGQFERQEPARDHPERHPWQSLPLTGLLEQGRNHSGQRPAGLYFFNRRGGQLRKKRSISAGSLLAVVRGPNTTASATPTMVRVYAVSSLRTRPTERCDLRSAANSRIESPSWSPDGTLLAWGERGGIWVSPIAGGAGDCAAAPKRLIAGGSQPDWGPANLPKR